jgi:hypothetical protein
MYCLLGKSEGKRSRGKPKRRREDNIKINLTAVTWEGVDWISLAQDKERWWEF